MTLARGMVKLAEEDTKRRAQSYPRAVLAALPYTAAQSVSDVPKGAIERVTTNVVGGHPANLRSAMRLGGSKAVARFGASALTTPAFLSGVKDMQADDQGTQRRGALKVLGSAAVYGGGKGALETMLDKGISHPDVLPAMKGAFGARGAFSMASGLLTAKAIADSVKKGGKGKEETGLKPMLIGGGLAGAEGVVEHALQEYGQRGAVSTRAALARGAGRAVAGAAGAALLTAMARHAAKNEGGKEKTASVGMSSYSAYEAARSWSAQAPPADVQQEVLQAQAQGKLTPFRRAVVQGLIDGQTGRKPARPQPPGVLDTTLMGAVLAAPEVALGVVESLPRSQRDRLLRDAIDRLAVMKLVSAGATARGTERAQPGRIFINSGTSAAVAAHELGHATAGALRQSTTASVLASRTYGGAAAAAAILPVLVLVATAEKDFATPEDYEARASFLSRFGKVATLAATPKLAEEALASAKGLRYLVQAGAAQSEVLSAALTRYLPAFAAYAAPLALPAVAAYRLRKKARDAREEAR